MRYALSIVSTLASAMLLLALSACGDGGGSGEPADAGIDAADPSLRPGYSANWQRDILSYDLQIDLAAQSGVATIVVAGDTSTGMSLAVGNLIIDKVSDSFGDLMQLNLGQELLIGVPAGGETRTVVIDYHYRNNNSFNGWSDEKNLSFLWPDLCGNFFPCNPDPAEGASFTISVSGMPEGASGVVVYPASIPGDAPAYMPAIVVGDYSQRVLGTTPAGTEVSVWHRPGETENADIGTANLVGVFDFLEKTYGPYSFGNKVGTVSVTWGVGQFGGMEHHPLWHVADGALNSEEVNAHEAAHGWYGNGVRIACWEDFVLSEGVVTYMAARALEGFGVDLWADTYDCELSRICNGAANTIALLNSCGEIDIINHPLWSNTPYQKGAQYLREVALLLGKDVVDQALAEFYQANVGKAAHMRGLVELLKSKGNAAEIEALTLAWLETESCPVSAKALCPG